MPRKMNLRSVSHEYRVGEYRDEEHDRERLKSLYRKGFSYQTLCEFWKEETGVAINRASMRLIIKGYKPGDALRKQLHWPPRVKVEVCGMCGKVHVRKTCPTAKGEVARKRTRIDLPSDLEEDKLDKIRQLSKEERAERLLNDD